MKQASFNVLTEPWIPVIRLDGTREELGILPCLGQAHEIREIRDPSPIIEFSLYRLLVAFILDALILADERPEDPLDLKKLIKKGRFSGKFFKDYAGQCGEVFDLFHPKRPFLQINMDEAKAKPLAGLYPAMPSGSNAGHWDHRGEEAFVMSPAEAAKLLTTVAPFMTAGGPGLSPSINGSPGVYVLPIGVSLFETLVMNLPLRIDQDVGNGTVAWRSKTIPGGEKKKATMAEALTWRPRKIQLIPVQKDGKLVVKEMKFIKGDSTRLPKSWIDPNLGYAHKKDDADPVRMRENRPLWRDAGPLSFLRGHTRGEGEKRVVYQMPDVVKDAFSLSGPGAAVQLKAYGLRIKDLKMKFEEWARVDWSIPSQLGRSERLGSRAQMEYEAAENVAYGLRNSLKMLYPRDGSSNKNALGSIIDRCECGYWTGVESEFQSLLWAFADLEPEAVDDPARVAEAASSWRRSVKESAMREFELVAEDMDANGDALERQVRARSRLYIQLKKVLS